MRALCLALALLLTLPAPAALAQDGTTQPDGAIAVADDKTTDAAIAVRIRDILGQLEPYADVTVTVTSGIVTLRGETPDPESAARLTELITRVEGVVAIENEVIATANLAEQLSPAMERFQTRMTQIVRMLPLMLVGIAAGLVVLLIGLFIARRVRFWQRLAPNAFIAEIYRHAIRIAFGVAGLVIALDIMNATALLGTILGAAGIIGLALGFAVKDTVENFIASVMLSIRQPFRPNDAVEINGDEGKVIRLTSRATILLSWDGNHIRIPNATVFKSRIVNYTRNAERRFLFHLGIDDHPDLSAARHLLETTTGDLPFTLAEPAPSVWLDNINENGVVYTVTGWIDQNATSLLQAKGEAMRLCKAALEGAGYAIADTTYRLRLDGTGAVTEAAPDAPPPKPADRPSAPAAAEPETVTAETEAALDRMVEAERADVETTDLLNKSAKLD